MIYLSRYRTPLGTLILGATESKLVLCDWSTRHDSHAFISRIATNLHAAVTDGYNFLIATAEKQLDEYFSGRRRSFDMPLLLSGTPFQESVWHAIATIPYGETTTYSDIAAAIGHPEAVRAVANAIGANRLSIILPCHRVTGCNNPGGYAGGIDIKQGLLLLEKSYNDRDSAE
ncbi:MAG: methylated-DNA--[protein]-cysteine S-methyltransferase [Muribaculaceae bacterium]|nr:methylated-DNA--[protein]-cysteine S-methyltransferase [Muribaculaceae bacterium]